MNDVPDYSGPLPEGWTGGAAKTKFWKGAYVHLYTLKKPCAQCGRNMVLDVSRNAIEGKAANSGLRMKRCADCRAKDPVTNSRPIVEGEPMRKRAPAADPAPEIEQLRATVETMRQELEGLYALNRELREKYEGRIKMPWE